MDKIKGQEKGRKSVTHVSENVVQIDHVTLNKATGIHWQCRWIFDFTDVSREELEIMAARKLVIDYRVPFKGASPTALDGLENQTFMVREILSATPQRLDPMTKAKKALIALSPEDIAELLAERQHAYDTGADITDDATDDEK